MFVHDLLHLVDPKALIDQVPSHCTLYWDSETAFTYIPKDCNPTLENLIIRDLQLTVSSRSEPPATGFFSEMLESMTESEIWDGATLAANEIANGMDVYELKCASAKSTCSYRIVAPPLRPRKGRAGSSRQHACKTGKNANGKPKQVATQSLQQVKGVGDVPAWYASLLVRKAILLNPASESRLSDWVLGITQGASAS